MSYARQATEDLPDVIHGVEFDNFVRRNEELVLGSEYRIYASAAPAKAQMSSGRGKSRWVGYVVWKRVEDEE
jgi:hypothetical protein